MNLKKIPIILFLILICLYSEGQISNSKENPRILRAGFARINITPSMPVKLYGYASRKEYSEGVHDSLYFRVSVFENQGKKIVLVSSDLGSFSNELFLNIQKELMGKFGLKESEIFLSTIHSHSSPVLSSDEEKGDRNNIEYTKVLREKLVEAVGQAIHNIKPVLTGVGSGSSPVGANRREMLPDGSVTLGRNPYGITDKEVLVLKVTDTTGENSAVLFDYATHSTSLGPANLKISGDVLGLSAQFTEKILGKSVITPAFAGASGNIDPWYRVLPEFNAEPGWIPEPVLLGTLLGEEVIHVLRNIEKLSPGGIIETACTTIECPAKKHSDENKIKDLADSNPIPVLITVACIGDNLAFIGFNVEMLTEIGMQIKTASPFRDTFLITHCNGYTGYLAPPELYKEGGYEISSTPFDIVSSDMVVKKALAMLYDLKNKISSK